MALDESVISKLFEGFDAKLVSEELKSQVKEMINSIVDSRVKAQTTELQEKEKYFLEQTKALKTKYKAQISKVIAESEQKQKIMEEEAQSFADKVAKTLAEKEAIMVNESENYRIHAESIIAEEASQYRDVLEKIIVEECDVYRQYIEDITLQEAVEFKKQQEAALAEEVGEFKGSMVDSISEFLESELEKNIPSEIMEAAVKVAAYEPLVEGIVKTFGESYIKLDTTSYDVISEARKENEKLSESVNAKAKENVRLQAEVKSLGKKVKLSELTEGMTDKQKAKASKLLENCSTAKEVETEFNKIQDLIIESSIKEVNQVIKESKKPTNFKTKSQDVSLSVTAKNKINRIKNNTVMTESANPEMSEWETRLERQLRNS